MGMVANAVMPTLNQKLKPMPTMADMVVMEVMVDTVDTMVANAVLPKLNQKLKLKLPQLHTTAMVDTEDMVDTVDTMAASADPLKPKLPQLYTMVVMVDTEDMVDTVDTMVASADLLNHTTDTEDMVDTDTVDTTEDKPNPQLSKTIT